MVCPRGRHCPTNLNDKAPPRTRRRFEIAIQKLPDADALGIARADIVPELAVLRDDRGRERQRNDDQPLPA